MEGFFEFIELILGFPSFYFRLLKDMVRDLMGGRIFFAGGSCLGFTGLTLILLFIIGFIFFKVYSFISSYIYGCLFL